MGILRYSPILFIILLTDTVIFLCPVACGDIIYVDDDAIGDDDGTSWENAFVYLKDALDAARNLNTAVEVHIAQGVYTVGQGSNQTSGNREATFYLAGGVSLMGGFAGLGQPDADLRDIRRYSSILTGDLHGDDANVSIPVELHSEPTRVENSYHVVTVADSEEAAILDGLTITGGNASGPKIDNEPDAADQRRQGGGLYCLSSSAYITHCNFSGNYALYGGGVANIRSKCHYQGCTFVRNAAGEYGGAMANFETEQTVTDCTFNTNAALWGGGVANQWSSLEVANCSFSGNHASFNGGGISSKDSTVMLIVCDFRTNVSRVGGGMYNLRSEITLSNCLLANNSAYGSISLSSNNLSLADGFGAAIFDCNSVPTLTNCTIVGNTAAKNAGGIYCVGSNPILANCILWNNSSPQMSHNALVTFSNIQNGWPGQGNINIDPMFVMPGYWHDNGTPYRTEDDVWIDGDYHLMSKVGRYEPVSGNWIQDDFTSPCIDAGDPTSFIGSEPAPNRNRINMGAYGGTEQASKSP